MPANSETDCCGSICIICRENEERIEQVKLDLAEMLRAIRSDLRRYYRVPVGERDHALFAEALARMNCFRMVAYSIDEPHPTFEQVEREVLAEFKAATKAEAA